MTGQKVAAMIQLLGVNGFHEVETGGMLGSWNGMSVRVNHWY